MYLCDKNMLCVLVAGIIVLVIFAMKGRVGDYSAILVFFLYFLLLTFGIYKRIVEMPMLDLIYT